MARLAAEDADDPTVVSWARRAVRKVARDDVEGEARALLAASLRDVRWTHDPVVWSPDGVPQGVEYVEAPRFVLRDGAADCDEISTLIGAGLMALGRRSRFIVVGTEGQAKHVCVEALGPEGWITIDPVPRPPRVGLNARVRGARMAAWNARGQEVSMTGCPLGMSGVGACGPSCNRCGLVSASACPRGHMAGPTTCPSCGECGMAGFWASIWKGIKKVGSVLAPVAKIAAGIVPGGAAAFEAGERVYGAVSSAVSAGRGAARQTARIASEVSRPSPGGGPPPAVGPGPRAAAAAPAARPSRPSRAPVRIPGTPIQIAPPGTYPPRAAAAAGAPRAAAGAAMPPQAAAILGALQYQQAIRQANAAQAAASAFLRAGGAAGVGIIPERTPVPPEAGRAGRSDLRTLARQLVYSVSRNQSAGTVQRRAMAYQGAAGLPRTGDWDAATRARAAVDSGEAWAAELPLRTFRERPAGAAAPGAAPSGGIQIAPPGTVPPTPTATGLAPAPVGPGAAAASGAAPAAAAAQPGGGVLIVPPGGAVQPSGGVDTGMAILIGVGVLAGMKKRERDAGRRAA